MVATDLVTLDPVQHRYIHVPTGRPVPSVTSILQKSGVRYAPFTGGGSGSGGPRAEAVRNALKRGRDVHRLTRAIDEAHDVSTALDDVFDPADLSVENITYVAAYEAFMRMSGYRPVAWETIVFHEELWYAGKADGIGWFGAERAMIDRKTDKVLHKSVFLQLCLYRMAWNSLHPNEQIDKSYAVVLRSDQTFKLVQNPLEPGDVPFCYAAIWMARWHDMAVL